MHAASVNPEPGSNSLKNYISSPSGLKTFFRAIICSFYFCLSSILKKLRDSSFTHLHMLCTSSLVVQFSMTNAPFPSFSGQLVYYITIFSICQALFSIFLIFFKVLFKSLRVIPSLVKRLAYFITSARICQEVFATFFDLFPLFTFWSKTTVSTVGFCAISPYQNRHPIRTAVFLIYLRLYISNLARGCAPCCTYTDSDLLRRFRRMRRPYS